MNTGAMLTAEQVAQMIGMDRKTVIRRALAGELAYLDFGSAYRFTVEDVEIWIKSRRVEPAKKK